MQSMNTPPVHFDDEWEFDEHCPDHCEDKVPLGGHYHCPVCDREWIEDGEDEI